LHAFGTTAPVRNIRFLYNVGINTATQAGGGWLLRNDINGTMENILFQGNMIYGNRTTSVLVLGPNAPAGRDLTFVDNYVWGGTTEFKRWTNLQVTGNTFAMIATRLYANSPTFPTVPVDVSSVLRNNDQYEVRNVQDFFGAPVLRGTYLGGTLAIPMIAVTPSVPLGGWPGAAPPLTGPEFNAFVVQRTAP